MDPKLYLKIGDQPEIEANSITQSLKFLSADENPSIANSYQENTGQDGSDFNVATFNRNIVNANFWLHFKDWQSYKLAKHEIYRKLMTKETIRMRTDVEMGKVMFVRAGNFEVKPVMDNANDAVFTIPFDNPSGYKYSLYPSNQFYKYSVAAWQYGMNLPIPTDNLKYHFTNLTNLYVYNASDITIDPYYQKHDLKIIMKRYGNQHFGLVNNTTGTSWNYHGSLELNDTLILDGINTYKNGITDNLNTDYGYLTLAPGWNNISVTGVQDLDILFSFPFIYLA
ncbi:MULTISPECIES: phage tail domain-containing protein [Bacillati]|uniref:phage tail domain-containing protein n=1 Tax=Bacillati TaxID=1783272 RepID=UPI00288A383F|nr:phage tail domain-containing protein [Liquorilactobacillus uvarum]